MLVFYDGNGAVLYTLNAATGAAPPGDHIVVPDDTDVSPLPLLSVVAGALVKAAPDQEMLRIAVNEERDRRLPLPFTFNGTEFDRDPVSVSRINGAGTLALGAMVNGAQPGDLRWHGGTTDFGWIAYDGSIVNMDAQTVFAFGQAAAKRETELVFSAKALKMMDPIPTDFADDGYWP